MDFRTSVDAGNNQDSLVFLGKNAVPVAVSVLIPMVLRYK